MIEAKRLPFQFRQLGDELKALEERDGETGNLQSTRESISALLDGLSPGQLAGITDAKLIDAGASAKTRAIVAQLTLERLSKLNLQAEKLSERFDIMAKSTSGMEVQAAYDRFIGARPSIAPTTPAVWMPFDMIVPVGTAKTTVDVLDREAMDASPLDYAMYKTADGPNLTNAVRIADVGVYGKFYIAKGAGADPGEFSLVRNGLDPVKNLLTVDSTPLWHVDLDQLELAEQGLADEVGRNPSPVLSDALEAIRAAIGMRRPALEAQAESDEQLTEAIGNMRGVGWLELEDVAETGSQSALAIVHAAFGRLVTLSIGIVQSEAGAEAPGPTEVDLQTAFQQTVEHAEARQRSNERLAHMVGRVG